MPASINTNASAMAAIRSLAMLTKDLATTQGRIESGLRVGGAKDDPAVFAISQTMRADLNGMTAVKDSLAFGKAALGVADAASKKISDELGKLKQTIIQGQQQGLDTTMINQQITGALANIDAFAKGASFNDVNLLKSSPDTLNLVRDIAGSVVTISGGDSTTGGLGLTGLSATSKSTTLSFSSDLVLANADTVSFTLGNGDTYTFEFSDASAALTTTPSATDKVFDVQIASTDSTLQALGKLISRIQDSGLNASFNNDGEIVLSGGGITAASGTVATGTITATAANGPAAAIAQIDGALDTMGGRMATIGAGIRQVEGLQEFTAQLADSVKEGLGAMVDADLTEESARLSTLQTKQQLSTQSLSIANQSSQALLSLFR